jgi:hypothetical protein
VRKRRRLAKVRISDGNALREGLAVVGVVAQCVDHGDSFEVVATELPSDRRSDYHTHEYSLVALEAETVADKDKWKLCSAETRSSLTTHVRWEEGEPVFTSSEALEPRPASRKRV